MAQALNATFFAFRKRERGGVLLGASLAFIVLAAAICATFFFLNAKGMMDYINWATNLGANAGAGKPGAPVSMDAMMPPASVMALGPAYLLFTFAFYLLFAAYEAACLRWMIRGETEGLLGLSLGADTWRVWFGYWVWFFLIVALYIVFAVVAGGAVFSSIAMSQGGAGGEINPAAVLVPLVLGFGLVAALIFVAVRFAPAAATSIARRRFAFFDAWTVSKGRFWALLGAFVLLFVMFFVFYMVVGGTLGAMMAFNVVNQIGNSEPQSAEEAFRAFANPQAMAMIGALVAVMSVASLLLYVAMFGVNARAAQAALEEGKIQAAA